MVEDLFSVLRSRGIRLETRDGRLICHAPPGALSADLQARIRAARDDLVERLAAAAVLGSPAASAAPIPPAPDRTRFPLSATQRRTAWSRTPTSGLPAAWRLRGPLDPLRLAAVLRAFVDDHDQLRACFDLEGSEGPVQTILDPVHVDLECEHLHVEGADDPELAARQHLDRLARADLLDVTRGRCAHFATIWTADDECFLFASFSPYVFDGACFDLFVRALADGLASGAAERRAPQVRYADYVSWQERRVTERDNDLLAFWTAHLGERLPLDVFPLADPGPHDENGVDTVPLVIPAAATTAVRDLARRTRTSEQSVLLAAVACWATRLRGAVDDPGDPTAKDVVLGVATEGRPHQAREVVGSFASVALLRIRSESASSFEEVVRRTHGDLLDVHEHRDFPIERVPIRLRPGSAREFQIEFSYQQVADRPRRAGDVDLEQIELPSGAATTDLTFWVKDDGERIAGAVEFRVPTLDPREVRAWVDAFGVLLDDLASRPGDAVGAARLLDPAALETLRATAADTTDGVRVVDDRGRVVPLGVPGHVRGAGTPHALRADGTLQRVAEERGPGMPESLAAGEAAEFADDIEVRIAQIVGDLLDTSVAAETDLFSAGLTSLLALRLVDAVEDRLGVRIAAAQVFERPTVRRLAERIRAGTEQVNLHALVPLGSTQDAPALYCLCGIHLYHELAVAFGDELACHGLYVPTEMDQLQGGSVDAVRELARAYWETIRARHDENGGGPLRLLGFCLGGGLAYEVALRASAEGAEVRDLVLVDSALATRLRRRRTAQMRSVVRQGVRRVRDAVAGLQQGRDRAPAAERLPQYEVLSRILDRFTPEEPWAGRTTVVDSCDPAFYRGWRKTPYLGWDRTLVGDVARFEARAPHLEVMRGDSARDLARFLLERFSS